MYHVATHSGKFHADDVLAFAMIKEFFSDELNLSRTRDLKIIEQADIVFDVGGVFNPINRRFDHHQKVYTGPLSSAGMVLNWLEAENHVEKDLAVHLRQRVVDYVDDVDNGRIFPNPKQPCFSTIVDAFNQGCQDLDSYNVAYRKACLFTQQLVHGFRIEFNEIKTATKIIEKAIKKAEEEGSNLIELEAYVKWKSAYFKLGGKEHPTEFIMFPTLQGTVQCVAIPPEENSFAQKRSFPSEWAGLVDDELSTVCGVGDAVFCHKNRFLFICKSKDSIRKAMRDAQLLST